MAELNPIPLSEPGFYGEKQKVGLPEDSSKPTPADLDRLFSSGVLNDLSPSQALDIQQHRRSTRTLGNMVKGAPGAVVQAAKDIGPGIYESAQLATSFNPIDRVKLALGLAEGGLRGTSELGKLATDIYQGRIADPIRTKAGADPGVLARQRLLDDRDFKEKSQGMVDGTEPSHIQDLAVLAANTFGLDPNVAQQLAKPPQKTSVFGSYFIDPTLFAPGVGALRLPAKGRRILDATRKVQQASTPVPNVFGAQNRATAAAVGAVEEAAKPSPGIIQRGVEKGADLSGTVSQKAAQAFDFLEPYKTPLRVAGASVGAIDGGVVGGILGSRAPEAINILGRTSKGAHQISKALRSISRADWASRVPVYMQVAKSAEAPAWLKTLATQRVRGVPVASFLESGLRGVTPTVKGAASGSLIGGGLMYGDPNKTGEEIGAGSAVGFHLGAGGGLLGHIASHKQRVATAAAYDKLRFIDQAIKDGTDPNVAFKADESLLDTAVVLQALFEGAFPGAKGLTVKLVSPDDPNVRAKDSGQTQAGSFDPATNTAFINIATKDADGRLIHEVLGHGLLETYVSNKPSIIETINGLLSVEQIDAAKLDYAKAVLGPDADDALINSYLKNQNEFDVNWVHTEIFAEAIANSLRGADMLAGTKTIFGRKNRQSFFKDKDTRNAIFSDAMQNLVKEEFEALRDFTPGKDEGKERGTKLKREMAGNHPGFVVENQGDGTKGNDFVTVTPGGQVVPRPQKQVRKRTRSRRKETKQFFPDRPPVDFRDKDKKVKNRKTPSGKNEKTGTELGEDWHNNSTTFGDQAKQNARIFEEVIKTGDALAAWYQQVIPKVRATIKDTMGGMEVQYKDFIPYAFKVDSRGNILVQNYSLTALYRKINRWLKSDDMELSLAQWNNNKEAFVKDVKQYLNNHATGKPGAEGLGDMATVKRDIINAFLVGKNVTYEAKNPLRSKLNGDDRTGIIRSYRLDRFQTVFESEITGYKSGDYEKWLQNLSPEIQPKEPKFLTPDQIKSQTIQRNERPATTVPGHLTRIESDTGGRRFADGIRWSARDHKLGAAVEVKSPEFYRDPSTALFLGDDGLAGTAVTKTGDLVSVFKHPDSVSDIRPILADASLLSTTLDAFDVNGFLPNLYSAYGFKPAARVKWNDDYAPPGWPYDLAGRPDVVLMVKDPNNILPEVTADFADIRDQYPLFEDYDAAMAVQQELKQKVVGSGLPDFTRYSPEVEESIPVLNVQNEKGFPFADQIIDGQKTIETREHTRLDPLIGKTVKIARTGGKKGGPVIGEVTITGRVDYPTRESFLADADKHLVREGSAFDFTKPKYGYTLENPKRYKEEYKAKVPRGRIYDSSQPGPRYSPEMGPMGSLPSGEGAVLQKVATPILKGPDKNITSFAKIRSYIHENKIPKLKHNTTFKDGKPVGVRIDIPTFERSVKNGDATFVQSIHEPWKGQERGRAGKLHGYTNIATVENPRFSVNENEAYNIKEGKHTKNPIATVEGTYRHTTEIPADIDSWSQAGFNPKRHSYFYDRETGQPITGGDVAISSGNTVFVKNPVFADGSNFLFSPQISNKNLAQNRGPWYSIGDGSGQTSQASRAFQSAKIKAYLQGAKEGAASPARLASDISGTGKPEPWLKQPTSLNDRNRVIDAEDTALQTWAKESGWYVEPGDLRNLFSEAEDTFTGNEHMVYVLPGGDFVVKRTINNMFGGSPATMETPSGYLQQLVDYNSVVPPQLQKTFLGVSTDALGNGVIVTAQPYISGKKPSDAQLKAVMRRAGFEHISGGEYKHTDTGAVIMDAEPRNVFVQDGQPLPIDVWVKFPEERQFFSPELNDESIIISTRYPTASKATENPMKNLLVSDLEAMNIMPDQAETNFKKMRAYPNFKVQTSDFKIGTEQIIDHMVKNLLWLYDNYPEQYRELAMQWYPGANGISKRWAQKYGHSLRQVGGVLAVLSPQKDWFANVSMAERLLDIYRDNYDFVYNSEMDATRAIIYNPSKPKRLKDKEAYAKLEKDMPGQSLKSLIEKGDFYTAASFARTFSQTYHDPRLRILNPRGEILDFVTEPNGNISSIRWQGNNAIGKALQILNDGSIANISKLAGDKHKVRNFFNNIVDPNNPAGFVTMDTHAVAAALFRALGSTDKEVGANFGTGSANSSITGVWGTYPIYGEAYTRAAAQRGVLPRAMQSVTWEAGKSLFAPEFKRSLGKNAVEDVWKAYKKGEITHEQAIEKVATLAGGLETPSWAGSSGGLLGEGTHTSYSQKLPNR